MAASANMPDGMEPGLENVAYYDPPNLTWPFACYIATVEVDPETGVWDVLRMVGVDDCGVRINPMIVEGQVHGGAAQGIGYAGLERIVYDPLRHETMNEPEWPDVVAQPPTQGHVGGPGEGGHIDQGNADQLELSLAEPWLFCAY